MCAKREVDVGTGLDMSEQMDMVFWGLEGKATTLTDFHGYCVLAQIQAFWSFINAIDENA
jgi:hypothetical protein